MDAVEWERLTQALRNFDDIPAAVAAAEQLHRNSTLDDLPRLRELLNDGSFFVREAAAWPVSELAGADALSELFRAYQRGFDEGHDNDGFTIALIELAAAESEAVRIELARLARSSDPSMRVNATWLLEFCGNDRPSH